MNDLHVVLAWSNAVPRPMAFDFQDHHSGQRNLPGWQRSIAVLAWSLFLHGFQIVAQVLDPLPHGIFVIVVNILKDRTHTGISEEPCEERLGPNRRTPAR